MKNITTKKRISARTSTAGSPVWHSLESTVKELSKDADFRTRYDQEMEMRRLAREIRAYREALKLTQSEVAHRAGMTQSVIARLEKGARGTTVDTLGRVASVLHKKVELV